MIEINTTPLIIALLLILIALVGIVALNLFFGDKHNNREHELQVLIEKNRTNILQKYTGEDGELDTKSMVMDIAVQNQMIIDCLNKIKSYF